MRGNNGCCCLGRLTDEGEKELKTQLGEGSAEMVVTKLKRIKIDGE